MISDNYQIKKIRQNHYSLCQLHKEYAPSDAAELNELLELTMTVSLVEFCQLRKIPKADMKSLLKEFLDSVEVLTSDDVARRELVTLFFDEQTDTQFYKKALEPESRSSYWNLLVSILAEEKHFEQIDECCSKSIEMLRDIGKFVIAFLPDERELEKINMLVASREESVKSLAIEIEECQGNLYLQINKERAELLEEKRALKKTLTKRLKLIGIIYIVIMILVGLAAMVIRGPVDINGGTSTIRITSEGDYYNGDQLDLDGDSLTITREYSGKVIQGKISRRLEPKNAFGKSTVAFDDRSKGWIQIKGESITSSAAIFYEKVIVKYQDEQFIFGDIWDKID